ncbi:hypothetical protein R9D66_004264 [Citrobacter amalonaticus]|nr:hypothetical protein [Citrobacter amalonaticus]
MKILIVLMILVGVSGKAIAANVMSPSRGVVCDKNAGFCVDYRGISMGLTKFYLGKQAEDKLLITLGDNANLSEYTFSNGIYCDSKEKQCYNDRYYPRTPDKRNINMTKQIFGQ